MVKVDWRKTFELVKTAASAWVDDYAPSMGAALSYYSVFSLAPLLLLVISIAGLVFGEDAARGALFGQLAGLMGADAADTLQQLLAGVSKPSKGIVGTIIGIVVLLVGATTVFGELQDALDRIWRAPARKKGGLWGLLRSRFLSFGMILGIAFLLMVSLVVSAGISAFGSWWGSAFVGWEILAQVINAIVGFAFITGIFAMIYKLMPRVHIRWHDVWLGAAVTSLLFNLGRFLIGLYIGKSNIATGFGAAGSLIIVFVWVYYSAQIFLMGAEFTWVYAKTFGSLRDTPIAHPATTSGVAVGGATPAAQSAPAEPVAAIPTRSGSTLPAPAPAGAAARRRKKPTLADHAAEWSRLGAAIAAGFAIRHVLPKMLRRW